MIYELLALFLGSLVFAAACVMTKKIRIMPASDRKDDLEEVIALLFDIGILAIGISTYLLLVAR
jgi:hypothetical protein